MTRKAILVLGMHRSGTSAVAGSIVQRGAAGPKSPLPPTPENPMGYWEPKPVVQFHDRMLSRLGLSWDSWDAQIDYQLLRSFNDESRAELRSIVEAEFEDEALFVLKDPRTALFLPVWLEEAQKAAVTLCPVLVLRSPLEVALSLKQRNLFGIDTSVLIWLRYNLLAERWTRHIPRCVIAFDEFLRDPEIALSRLGSHFSIPWENSSVSTRALIDPLLRHHVDEDFGSISNDSLRTLAKSAYEALHKLVSGNDLQAISALDAIAESLDRALSLDPELRPKRATVTNAHRIGGAQELRGYNLEMPRSGTLISNTLIDVGGWALANASQQLQAIEIWHDDVLVDTTPVENVRTDVAAAFPLLPHAVRSGFRFIVRLPEDGETFSLKVIARLHLDEDKIQRVAIGEISGQLHSGSHVPACNRNAGSGGGCDLINDRYLKTPDTSWSGDIHQGIRTATELCQLNQIDRARELLEALHAQYPTEVAISIILAIVYRRAGRSDQAARIVLSLVDKYPDWRSLRFEAAIDLQSLGRHSETVDLLTGGSTVKNNTHCVKVREVQRPLSALHEAIRLALRLRAVISNWARRLFWTDSNVRP